MEQYTYYSVLPKNIETKYSYLSDRDIPVGSYVEIPFGYNNTIHQGRVMSKGVYTRESAPWPVEKTKKILRVISEKEYNAGTKADWVREIRELEGLIAEEDYAEVYNWAVEHHNCVDNPEIMDHVVRAYRVCAYCGDSDAALNLGSMYYSGLYLTQDYHKAAELYQMAADKGNVRGLCGLGYCFYYGRHQAADYEAAFRCFSLGAALENDPNCLYKLGDLYWHGLYVKQNQDMAERLYFHALEECDKPRAENYCRADILLRVGRAYLEGSPERRDAKRALDYFMQALSGFYDRRKTDPFAADPIAQAKDGIQKAVRLLDKDLMPYDIPEVSPVSPEKKPTQNPTAPKTPVKRKHSFRLLKSIRRRRPKD